MKAVDIIKKFKYENKMYIAVITNGLIVQVAKDGDVWKSGAIFDFAVYRFSYLIETDRCAKQQVIAIIRSRSGEEFIGSNWCKNPQEKCPRQDAKTGEAYHLCNEICGLSAHAEINALNKAGRRARGAQLYLIGHTYSCGACVTALRAAGVAGIWIKQKIDDEGDE